MHTDVTHELTRQVLDRSEDGAGNDVALDFGEPVLDLIEPGGVSRGEVQVNIGMLVQELVNALSFVTGKVIQHDVDCPAWGFQGHQLSEEGDQLFGGMARGSLAQYGPRAGIERGKQRERAMPIILKAVSFGSPGRQRQDPIESVERLDPHSSHRGKTLPHAAAG